MVINIKHYIKVLKKFKKIKFKKIKFKKKYFLKKFKK